MKVSKPHACSAMSEIATCPAPTQSTAIDLFAPDQNASMEHPSRNIVSGVAPGCFHMDVPAEEYHQLPDSVSCSGLKHLLRSPAHYQAYLEEPDDGKPNVGTALHCAVLEPERFDQEYTVFSGRRGTKVFDAFVQENPGKIILNEQEWIQVHGMLRAIMSHKEFPLWKALQTAKREMSVFWTDEETGVQCRVRFDALCAPFANFDLKTTTDARPEQFIKQAVRLDYDLQVAMYTEAAYRFTGEVLPFIFVAVEQDAPNGLWLLTAGQSMIDNGWKKFRRALSTYKTCKESGFWPGYTNAQTTIELPRYALLED